MKADKSIYEPFLTKLPLIERAQYLRSLNNEKLDDVSSKLKIFLRQKDKHFKLPDKVAKRVRTQLAPHKKHLRRFISSKDKRKTILSRRQKGGAFLTILLGALVPIVADLIIRAATKK